MNYLRSVLLLVLTLLAGLPARAQEVSKLAVPLIDGRFDDWRDDFVVARNLASTDPTTVGIKSLSAVAGGDDIYVMFKLDQAINLQGGKPNEPSLVLNINGLEIDFRQRTAVVQFPGPGTVTWEKLQFEAMPTYASDQFELKLSLAGTNYPIRPIEYRIEDIGWGGDGEFPIKVPEVEIPRLDPISIQSYPEAEGFRIANQNTLRNGLADEQRQGAFRRLFQAASADVYCFQEEWEQDKFNAGIESVLPGRSTYWNSGCAIATKHDLTPLPMKLDRAAAALIEPEDKPPVVVISVHFKCCGYAGSEEDDLRVQQAEQIAGEIRKLKTGDYGPKAAKAPVVVIGDYNLVGSRRPLDAFKAAGLESLLCYGRDRSTYTWRELNPKAGSFWPGRLDLAAVAGFESAQGFVMDSAKLPEVELEAFSEPLKKDDSRASDHLMLLVDVKFQASE